MARRFDPIRLEPPRDLTTRDRDPVVPDRHAYMLNGAGHIAYASSKALEIAGTTQYFDDPPGGEYGRYDDGSPNGVLYGQAAHLPVLLLNRQMAERIQSGFVAAGREVGDAVAAHGITTF